MDKVEVKTALVSVSSKTSLRKLLPVLGKYDVHIESTNGTAGRIAELGGEAKSIVSEFDFYGRLKSIKWYIFARIVADRSKETHMSVLNRLGLVPIDLVVCEFYKFSKAKFPECMDLGGHALTRAAVKNFDSVAQACDKETIGYLVDELKENNGYTTREFRLRQGFESLYIMWEFIGQEKEVLMDIQIAEEKAANRSKER